jgi:hypothetical protein
MLDLYRTTTGAVALSIIAFVAAFSQRIFHIGSPAIASAASTAHSQLLCQDSNEEVLFVSCGGFY